MWALRGMISRLLAISRRCPIPFRFAGTPDRRDRRSYGRASSPWFPRECWLRQLNACMPPWHETGHAYKAGFRKAAFELTSKVCEQPVDQDLIVYPIVYLYRHHIELVLKGVVRMALDLQAKSTTPAQERKLGGHDLLSLWTMARPMLEPVCEIVG
ncbi:hypothetical protein MES5069_360144 [Mesorhizobium escarrei]|uniref:Uncharacterized protein n=1 Tax=Mesorhizobium escarrei TaxID=666018 RepID=A0ABN8K1W2_9HYPH|nr:hypothetical protein MES5069_360144 [Mesorhizobium escarrei]